VRDSRSGASSSTTKTIASPLGHDSLALSQECPHHDGALWRMGVSSTAVCRVSGAQATPGPSSSVCPSAERASYPVVDVTLPARVWELGRSTQRESMRSAYAVVGRLASVRVPLYVVLPWKSWAYTPSAVSIVASS